MVIFKDNKYFKQIESFINVISYREENVICLIFGSCICFFFFTFSPYSSFFKKKKKKKK